MARLEIRRLIPAPPAAVWDVIADLERQAAWMVDVRRLEVVRRSGVVLAAPGAADAGQYGVGATLRVTSTLFGLPVVRDVMVVTAWEPPRRLAVEHRGQFHGAGEFRLDPAGGGTTFTWAEDFRPPLGPLGEVAFALVVRPHLRRVFSRSLANVARLAARDQMR